MPYSMGLAPARVIASELHALEWVEGRATLDFRWEDLPGPAAVDLGIGPAEAPLLQVFTSAGRPFARADLRVVPLHPARDYRLALVIVTPARPWQLPGEPGRRGAAPVARVSLTHLASSQVIDLGEQRVGSGTPGVPVSAPTARILLRGGAPRALASLP